MTTKITEKNVSNLANVGVEWQAVITGAGSSSSAVAGKGYFINTTSNTHTLNLPASPNIGDTITIKDYAGTFATNNVTVGRNGSNIEGNTVDIVLSTNFAVLELVYIDSTKGWIATSTGAEQGLAPEYISATGGTVTTVDTDYKVHTFTGDGCFVVATAGNAVGSNTVDYLVVAGGGGGGSWGGGGGGAGGYRESSGAASGCYTASPLGACVSALPVSASTYPITVGGGGAGAPSYPTRGCRTAGSPSIFSTITSTGGGRGKTDSIDTNIDGGSGGGRYTNCGVTGQGNTPPVSPPQGNPGGSGIAAPNYIGGGGGGALCAGNNAPGPTIAGAGGAGAGTAINPAQGTPGPDGGLKYFAGGGGGGGNDGDGSAQGSPSAAGGVGGGGAGGRYSCTTGTSGTANTGGGGGAAGATSPTGNTAGPSGSGGKGIVIIRYKFQN